MIKKAFSFLVGSLVLFTTILGPVFTLIAWLFSKPVLPLLALALLLSIPGLYSFWHTVNNSRNMTLRWLWMQAIGLGTVLLPLVVIASVFILKFNPQFVGLIVLCIWPLLSAIAVWQAHDIKIRRFIFDAPQLTKAQRIVQISDVHIGSRSAAFLEKVVNLVNEQQPDILVITGDLLDSSSVTATQLAALKNISCPAYMCIGNHERYVDLDKAISAISTNDVQVLRDELLTLNGLQLIGIDDRDKPTAIPEVINSLDVDPECFSVLLYHRPDGWQAAIDRGINLTLSGHTHAGQMFPFGLFVKRQYPNMAGLFEQDESALFVSTGTGTWGPIFRLGTNSEITVFDLKT